MNLCVARTTKLFCVLSENYLDICQQVHARICEDLTIDLMIIDRSLIKSLYL